MKMYKNENVQYKNRYYICMKFKKFGAYINILIKMIDNNDS